MALGGLPPWLQINPSDYLRAVEAGTNAGQAISNAAQRAWEEDQKMRMQQEQQTVENAAQRLAAERLDAYRQAEQKNAQQRLGIEQGGLNIRGDMEKIAQQRANDALDLGRERNQSAAERESDRQEQRTFRNDIASQMLDLKREGMDSRGQRGHYEKDASGKLYWAPESDPTKLTPVDFAKPPAPPQSHKTMDALKSFGGSLLDNFNIMGVHPFMRMPQQGTNAAPATPITNAVPALQSKRVRVKGPGGEKGTVPEGADLPDGWALDQ